VHRIRVIWGYHLSLHTEGKSWEAREHSFDRSNYDQLRKKVIFVEIVMATEFFYGKPAAR